MSVYLDCNATTPLEADVMDVMVKYLQDDYGNAGSRTHEFGVRAKQGVDHARQVIADSLHTSRDSVIFTSGATESNNIALLGLVSEAERRGKRHIISTSIEHKAVLEPLERLKLLGFEVDLLSPRPDGLIDPDELREKLRDDTLAVSIMHVNNETGAIQPLQECCDILATHEAFFHVDAAQGFGKTFEVLVNPRIDMLSLSAHKIFGPKGIGALVARRRGYKSIPLSPIMIGGGQERGLRPGTLPVHLIAGFGKAVELAVKHHEQRNKICSATKQRAMSALESLAPRYHGLEHSLPNTLNFSIEGINSEAAIVALKNVAAISNGSACTSKEYSLSHVLQAMKVPEGEIRGAVRISWCHLTEDVDWEAISDALSTLR